jgi:hypothetical protein
LLRLAIERKFDTLVSKLTLNPWSYSIRERSKRKKLFDAGRLVRRVVSWSL